MTTVEEATKTVTSESKHGNRENPFAHFSPCQRETYHMTTTIQLFSKIMYQYIYFFAFNEVVMDGQLYNYVFIF